jgi:aromatic-L-amino-acid decarboxylase
MPQGPTDDEVRAALHQAADWIADYLEGSERFPVLPQVRPGTVTEAIPDAPPEEAEPLVRILDDYRDLIPPATTHWNHPGFMAYFAITGSGPGVIGEALSAALNVNAMLWRTGPASTELELKMCDWFRQLLGLPAELVGHLTDSASTSILVALAAARHRLRPDLRQRGMAGLKDLPPLTLYLSEHAHSAADKAAVVLGIGLGHARRLAADEDFRLDVGALQEAVARDRARGFLPCAVVATAGTTSTASIDPLPEIAAFCRQEGLWLHVDAAYGGNGAICPEHRERLRGWEQADSLVVNPYKWLFVPADGSMLFLRGLDGLRSAFSLVPEYLTTPEEGVVNLMDLSFQLARRFRALKIWMVLRSFGARALREAVREHCRLALRLADWIAACPGFALAAPVSFGVVCFRARLAEADAVMEDAFNERLLAQVNAAGPVFLSHTRLHGRYVLRLVVGHQRTTEHHVRGAWELIQENTARLRQELAPELERTP